MAVDLNLETISSGYNTSKINSNFQAIDVALQDAVSRSGQAPNQMDADFDMNGNDILNVDNIDVNTLTIDGVPVSVEVPVGINTDALVPAGGTDGQVLTKLSSTSFDMTWEDPTGGSDDSLEGPVENILAYGAATTNTGAQNVIAIQAAIDAAELSGRPVYIPGGTFLTDDVLLLRDNVTMFGIGDTSIISSPVLASGGAGYGHRQLQIENISGVTIRDLCLDASGMTSWASGMRSILAHDSSDYTIRNIRFKTPGAATASIGCDNYRIEGNTVEIISTDGTAKHDGVIDQWGGCSYFTIHDNIVHGNSIGHYLVLVTGEDTDGTPTANFNFSIQDNTLLGAQDVGIWINGREGANADFTIDGNLVQGVTDFFGIAVADSVRGIVSNNVIRSIGLNGIRLYEETGAGGITGAVSVTVDGNNLSSCNELLSTSVEDGAAIAVVNTSSQFNTITNNRVSGTTHTFGLTLGTTTASNYVSGNYLNAGTRGSIHRGGSTNIIEREKLTAARSYYVRTDGNDINDGLANTSSRAFLTIGAAVTAAQNYIDTSGFDVSINVGAGTRTSQVEVTGPMVGGGILSIIGDTTTPANCIMNVADNAFEITHKARVVLRGFRISTSVGSCIIAATQASLSYGNIEFDTAASLHINMGSGAIVTADFNYSIIGGAVGHVGSSHCSFSVPAAITVTLTGTPAFSSYFAGVAGGAQTWTNATFVGSATGTRFVITTNGTVTGTSSLTFLPGDAAGSVNSGGKYVGDLTSQDIIGSLGSTDNAVLRADGTGTANAQGSSFIVDDTGHVSSFGGRIKFPGTAAVSTDVNTLDDYREGTWTPTVTFNNLSVGVTYTTQLGRYTKIGNRVLFECYIVLSSKGSSTGAARIAGLPFTESASGLVNAVQFTTLSGFTGLTAGGSGYITAGGTTVNLLGPNTTGAAVLNDTNFSNTSNFMISGNYTTTA